MAESSDHRDKGYFRPDIVVQPEATEEFRALREEVKRIEEQRSMVDSYIKDAEANNGLGYLLISRRLDGYRDRQIADLCRGYVKRNILRPTAIEIYTPIGSPEPGFTLYTNDLSRYYPGTRIINQHPKDERIPADDAFWARYSLRILSAVYSISVGLSYY